MNVRENRLRATKKKSESAFCSENKQDCKREEGNKKERENETNKQTNKEGGAYKRCKTGIKSERQA